MTCCPVLQWCVCPLQYRYWQLNKWHVNYSYVNWNAFYFLYDCVRSSAIFQSVVDKRKKIGSTEGCTCFIAFSYCFPSSPQHLFVFLNISWFRRFREASNFLDTGFVSASELRKGRQKIHDGHRLSFFLITFSRYSYSTSKAYLWAGAKWDLYRI